MAVREISRIVSGTTRKEGAGIKLVRIIGYPEVKDFDPFLVLDVYDFKDPKEYAKGFPWHPHRGIETITYLIHGEIKHGDSAGNNGRILQGGCQWMTAGKAVLHQEMPEPDGRLLGIQLWINLPGKNKMVPPKYRDISAQMIPSVRDNGSLIRILSGNYKGTRGAVDDEYIRITFFDVEMEGRSNFSVRTDPDETAFLYVLEGEGIFGGYHPVTVASKKAVLLDRGEEITVNTENAGLRFLAFCGNPIREPVAWGGPIVMNSGEELDKAFQEIKAGTFGK